MSSLNAIKLKIKRSFTVIPLANYKIHLHGGDKIICLDTNETLSAIIQCMDGKTSVSQLINMFKHQISRNELLGYLLELRRQDLIEDFPNARDEEQIECNTLLKNIIPSLFPPTIQGFKDNPSYLATIAKSKVCLLGEGENVLATEKILSEFGFQIIDRIDSSNLTFVEDHIADYDSAVMSFDSFRPTIIKKINHILIRHGVKFVYGAIEGNTVRIGPTVTGNSATCLNCYFYRLEERNPYIYEYEKYNLPRTRNEQALASLGTGIAYEIIGLLTGAFPLTFERSVFSYDMLANKGSFERIISKFGCEDCRRHDVTPSSTSVMLVSRCKKHFLDGGHRTVKPEETLLNSQHLVGRLGIVSFIERIDDASEVRLPVFASYTSVDPRSSGHIPQLRLHCGKGVHVDQAKASAIFEAIERYCAAASGAEPVVVDTWDNIQPDSYPIESFSPPYYWHCDTCNNRCAHITNGTPIDWVWGFSLAKSKPMLIPANLVFLPYRRQSQSLCAPFVISDSNGLAAGNNLEEAILHATLEVIERDAVTLCHRARTNVDALCIDDAKNPLLDYVLNEIEKNKLELFITYLPHALVHTVSAFIIDHSTDRPFYSCGSGSHPDPEIAVIRSITEANHIRLGIHRTLKSSANSVEEKRFDLESMRQFYHSDEITDLSDIPDLSSGDILDDIHLCLDRLKNVDSDILFYNLTKPGIDVPVVRVVLPWLQPADVFPCYRPSLRLKQYFNDKESETLKSAYQNDWLW